MTGHPGDARELDLGVPPHVRERVIQRSGTVRLLKIVPDQRRVEPVKDPEDVTEGSVRFGIVRDAHAVGRRVEHIRVGHETGWVIVRAVR